MRLYKVTVYDRAKAIAYSCAENGELGMSKSKYQVGQRVYFANGAYRYSGIIKYIVATDEGYVYGVRFESGVAEVGEGELDAMNRERL